MKIKSNILYDLLDQNTGEQVTFVKTTTGYDGTIITPENESTYIDGIVYKKLKASDGSGYAKRVSTKLNVEWFPTFAKALEITGKLKGTLVFGYGVNIDLEGAEITIPANVVLEFDGGIISNGTLIGTKTTHRSDIVKCYNNVTIKGTWTNSTSYLEWFIGEDKSSHIDNFKALCNCVEMDTTVELLDMYSIATTSSTTTYKTNNAIRITSKDKAKFGLILETIHSGNYAYFDSIDEERELIIDDGTNIAHACGLNQSIENITINTRDYLNNYTDREALLAVDFKRWYVLQNTSGDSRITDIDYIRFVNCKINGSVRNIHPGSSLIDSDIARQQKYGIKEVHILDNTVEYPYSLVSSTAYCKKAYIRRNKVYNNRRTLASFTYASDVYVEDNIDCYNDYIQTDLMSYPFDYLTLVMSVSGRSLTVRNNNIKDILSVAQTEVYPVYGSVENLIWQNNEFRNVTKKGGLASISLVKFKGTRNFEVINNKVSIDIETYVKLGLLEEGEDITLVDNTYKACIFDTNRNPFHERKQKFQDNEFSMPHINHLSFIEANNMEMYNNKITIDYIAPTIGEGISDFTALFHFQEVAENINFEKFIFNGNKFYIKQSHDNVFRVVTVYKISHKFIENCDNKFFLETPMKVVFGSPYESGGTYLDGHLAKNYLSTGNYVSNGQYEDKLSSNHTSFTFPFNTTFYANNIVNEYEEKGAIIGNGFIKTTAGFGISKLEILKNKSNVLGIMPLVLEDFYLNTFFSDSYPFSGVLVKITADFFDIKNKKTSLQYNFAIFGHARIVYWNSGTDSLLTTGVRNTSTLFSNSIQNLNRIGTDIELLHKNFATNNKSQILFNNILSYKRINIECDVQPIDFTGYSTNATQIAYYQSLVTPTAIEVSEEVVSGKGIFTQTVDDVSIINIPHGLTGVTTETPFSITPMSAIAAGYSFASIDDTNIIINYDSAITGEFKMSWII